MTTEMKVQHTPGPWEAYMGHDGQFLDEPLIVARTREGMPDDTVASVLGRGRSFTHANARLIAAAPTLLEALELALATIERLAVQHGPFNSAQGTMDIARQAIALAKGRTG